MLPEYIHMRVAESILFSGKAIKVLRNPGRSFRQQDTVLHPQFTRSLNELLTIVKHTESHKDTVDDVRMMEEELLPRSDEDKIICMLKDLKVAFIC